MATYQSTVMAKQTGDNAGKLLPVDFGGRVRVIHGSITPASAYASGSVLELAKLPKGARLLPISQLHFEAGQSASLTVKVGDSGDDDRYLAAKAPGASACSVSLDANRLGDYTFGSEDTVKITTGGTTMTASKKVSFDLYYVID